MISSNRASANCSTSSRSNSSRGLPAVSAIAFCAASSMRRSRIASSCCDILVFRLRHHPLSEVARQKPRRIQIDLASDQLRELFFNCKESQAGSLAFLELDQHVDIAICGEVSAQDRAKQSQTANVAPAAERLELRSIDLHMCSHARERQHQLAGGIASALNRPRGSSGSLAALVEEALELDEDTTDLGRLAQLAARIFEASVFELQERRELLLVQLLDAFLYVVIEHIRR